MASSKTLTPTNVTISIPAMTDAPDASVFSNCVDKEADAINALNSNIANKILTESLTVRPDADIPAGTPGTRGAQKGISPNLPSGYTIIGAIITYMENSNLVIPLVFSSSSSLYVNWYRANSSSISQSQASITIRMIYAKLD